MDYIFQKYNIRYYERMEKKEPPFAPAGVPATYRYKVIFRHPDDLSTPKVIGSTRFLKLVGKIGLV